MSAELYMIFTLYTAQKWSFLLRISSVNVTKSTVYELTAIQSICSEIFFSLSSMNNQGQGKHFVAQVDVTYKGHLEEIVVQR